MAFWPRFGSSAAPVRLQPGATVAVIGGGPAGAFFSLHLLSGARAAGLDLKVVIFEKNRRQAGPRCSEGCERKWRGCNYCAGGISPQLNDVLEGLGLRLPESVVQSRIDHLVVQGFWKNIELETPADRKMTSVFRGTRPSANAMPNQSFDAFLLDRAIVAGAQLAGEEVQKVERGADGKPVVYFGDQASTATLTADFVVFAAGVNETIGLNGSRGRMEEAARKLMPRFQASRTRKTLVFELEADPVLPAALRHCLFFLEYGSKELPIEMSSLVPKRRCITVVLVGRSVDEMRSPPEGWAVMQRFLGLPHVRRLFSPAARLEAVCFCTPRMVVGSARHPFGDRAAAVGDLMTARLYKDGILSAHQTGSALAQTLLSVGVDEASLVAGYEPTLRHFARDNRFAALVFLLHRFFFSSSVLSRVLYQAIISERKSKPALDRHLERILWRIASGDDDYEKIFWSLLRVNTVWDVVTGAVVTLRNYATEVMFGLRWEGFGRFTTGVAFERLHEKRKSFANLLAEAGAEWSPDLEFESMYTIRIGAPREAILKGLETFGEPSRGFLKPRWVRIRRVVGEPHKPGCVIRYEILHRGLCFHLRLERLVGGHLALYRVVDGFARGGVLLFDVEETEREDCLLSIYVAFNFPGGGNWAGRLFWKGFRLLFPAYVHDVVWNHSLCQLKEIIELEHHRTCQPGAN